MPRIAAVVPVLTLLLVAVVCPERRVSRVASDPAQYHGKRITVIGVVSHRSLRHRPGLYRIEEGGERSGCSRSRGFRPAALRSRSPGRVYKGYDVRGLNLPLPAGVAIGTVLVESSHRVVD